MAVPHLKVSVRGEEIVEGARALILPALRPHWDMGSVRFKIFTDGITNKLVGCFNGTGEEDVVLIRVYGNKTDLLIDRKAETRNFKVLHAAGLAPRLYATFDTGIAYEYAEGEALVPPLCLEEKVYPLVARTLADVHCVSATDDASDREPVLWGRLRRFLALVPDRFSDDAKEARYKLLFEGKPPLEEEFRFLKETLSATESPVVFCHNDLLLGNVIYNEEKRSVTFIDYEYAAYNYQAYDIANHFNEFAGVEPVDYGLFPGREYQIRWLRVYLERYKRNLCDHGGGSVGGKAQVTDEETESLYRTVQKFTMASHFLWAVWALIQFEYSSIEFDFLNYASVRLNQYFVRKYDLFPR